MRYYCFGEWSNKFVFTGSLDLKKQVEWTSITTPPYVRVLYEAFLFSWKTMEWQCFMRNLFYCYVELCGYTQLRPISFGVHLRLLLWGGAKVYVYVCWCGHVFIWAWCVFFEFKWGEISWSSDLFLCGWFWKCGGGDILIFGGKEFINVV